MTASNTANKTLSSFYNTQDISYELLPKFSLASIPIDLQKFPNEVTKKITIKCIKISHNKTDSIKFICGKSNKNNSRKNLPEWIKDDEVVNLIESSDFKLGVYEILFKKSSEDKNLQEGSFTTENISDLKELAELGVTNAQLILGLLYAKCIKSAEIEQDDNKALEWFKKNAEQGLVEGNLCLGYIYSKEKSSTYDPKEAITYYIKAADQGNSVAMRNLAIMYLVGEYESQNLKESIKLFRKANQSGDSVSGNILGILYQNGVGVPKDAYEAAKYYKKASELNDVNAKFNLGLLHLGKKEEVEGVKLFKEAAEKGFTRAQMLLAKAYESGQGIEQDLEKAFEWYSKVAEQEQTNSVVSFVGDAQFCLAKLYEKGFDTKEKDLDKALYWYTKSADNGNLNAQVSLGDMYRDGLGVEVDEKKALSLYIKAAMRDHYQAQFALGELYEKGLLVKKDENKALQWYKKSAKQGYIMALFRLGIESGEYEYVSRKVDMIKVLPPVKELENAGKAPQPKMVDDDEILTKINDLKDGETLEIDGSNVLSESLINL